MELVHYSSAPVTHVLTMLQSGGRDHIGKPHGFWFSVDGNDDGWRDWCLVESFRLQNLTHVHDVILAPDANIRYITDAAEIDAFTIEYQKPISDAFFYDSIDWTRVADDYQGIIIAPYIWERRLSIENPATGWYYSWDCASGCIWDARAISEIRLREIVPLEVVLSEHARS